MVSVAKVFERALLLYIRNLKYDIAEIVNYEEYTYYGGYCETCSYEEIRVQVSFKDSKGNFDTWEHYGTLGDLIVSLEKVDVDYDELDSDPLSLS